MSENQAQGGAVVDLALTVTGRVQGRLRVRIAGVPVDAGGGLSMTGSQVDLAVAGTPSVLQGRILSLQGERFTARVSDGADRARPTREPVDRHTEQHGDRDAGGVAGRERPVTMTRCPRDPGHQGLPRLLAGLEPGGAP